MRTLAYGRPTAIPLDVLRHALPLIPLYFLGGSLTSYLLPIAELAPQAELKTSDAGAKVYKEWGGKSRPEQRYWLYMLDSTEAQSRHLQANWDHPKDDQ